MAKRVAGRGLGDPCSADSLFNGLLQEGFVQMVPVPLQGRSLAGERIALTREHVAQRGPVPLWRVVVWDESTAQALFRFRVTWLWWRSLRRRSQKTKVTWERMKRLIDRWIPPARICHPYPLRRLGVVT